MILLGYFAGCQQAKNREISRQVIALEQRNAYLEDKVGQVDTVYRTDTLRLTNKLMKYDTARHELKLDLTDKVKIEAFIVAVDSTVAACKSVIATCETRIAYRDSIIATLDTLIKVERKRTTDWKTKLGYLLAGTAAGILIPR